MNRFIFQKLRADGISHAKSLSLANIYTLLEEEANGSDEKFFIVAADFVEKHFMAPYPRLFKNHLKELEELGYIYRKQEAGKGLSIKLLVDQKKPTQ